MKKISVILIVCAALFAAQNHLTMPPDVEVDAGYAIPYTGYRQSPGIEVGITDYDWQANGSMGRYVWVTPSGGYSFYWTYRYGGYNPSRRAYYNYYHPPSPWLGPTPMDTIYSRMGSLDQMTDGRAVGTAHFSITSYIHPRIYVDSSEGAGTFKVIEIPWAGDSTNAPIWPKPCVDDSNYIYVAASQNAGPHGCWTMSTDEGQIWTPWDSSLAGIQLNMLNYDYGGREFWAHYGNKIALINNMTDEHFTIVYWESTDHGTSWSYDTVYCLETTPGDSVQGFWWNSALYDNNGYLHVVFTVIDTAASGGGVSYSGWRSQIRHWNQQNGQMSVVNGYNNYYSYGWFVSNPGPGTYHPTVSEPQIAINRTNGCLYCTWCHGDTSDVAANGLVNMDIWGATSWDNGATWTWHNNITNSYTPGAQAGYCDNDHMNHVAEETVGDYMVMFYLNDKDAGFASGLPDPNATLTDSPLLFYLFDWWPWSIEENIKETPPTISISATPNPAARNVNISYTLAKSGDVAMKLYSIDGRLAKSMPCVHRDAGSHTEHIDLSELANGTYFVILETDTYKLSHPIIVIH